MTYALDNVEPTAIDSIDEIDTARLEHGSLRLEKGPGVPSPTDWDLGFRETVLSFDTDDHRVYRDTEATGTIEVREADDHYLVRRVEPRASGGERGVPTPEETADATGGGRGRSAGRLLLLVVVLAVAAAVAHRLRGG